MCVHELSCTHRDTSHDIEARVQIPRPLCMGTGAHDPPDGDQIPPPPRKAKGSNARGMPWGDVEGSI